MEVQMEEAIVELQMEDNFEPQKVDEDAVEVIQPEPQEGKGTDQSEVIKETHSQMEVESTKLGSLLAEIHEEAKKIQEEEREAPEETQVEIATDKPAEVFVEVQAKEETRQPIESPKKPEVSTAMPSGEPQAEMVERPVGGQVEEERSPKKKADQFLESSDEKRKMGNQA